MATINNTLVSKAREIVQRSSQRVYSKGDLLKIYFQIKWEGHRPGGITPDKFMDLLLKQRLFTGIVPTSPYRNPPMRFVWGEFSLYELACSIHKAAYLSHGTAAFLQGLTDQEPKTIYVNKEQSIKPQSDSDDLAQQALNVAFSRKQRQSKYVLRYNKSSITLLSGKNTGRFGVQKIQGQHGEVLEATEVERTLIDMTVRPAYAGGVEQVLQCYVTAKSMISPKKLITTLRKLDYVYPYHQAVGFYLQKAGFDPASWSELRKEELRYDFFLAHGIKKRTYDPEWRIFFPKGLHV